MDRTSSGAKAASVPSNHKLFPIMAFVFVGYLVIGIALPVVPLYVRNDLGLSNFVVGLVAGSPFLAALLSRLPAGRYADRAGAKRAVVAGLLSAVAGGVLLFISLAFFRQASVSVAILLVGRALLGVADSFVITGALSWGLKRLGAEHTGRVMAWVGTSLYAAFALGAPLGSALYASHGSTQSPLQRSSFRWLRSDFSRRFPL
jgi:MFS family permease